MIEGKDFVMSEIAPSILAADFNRLGESIHQLEKAEIKYLHIDVMDGMFVPSISFGMPVIASIRKESSLFFDVHLMIEEPARYYDEFVKAGADGITIHAEACKDLEKSIQELKKYPVKVAVSIKPDTSVEAIEKYLPELDMVLVMSVEPGFGGQKLIPSTLEKVEQLKTIREERGLSYLIEIDGGVNRENIKQVVQRGTDVVVAGTAVFQGDIVGNVAGLKEVIESAS